MNDKKIAFIICVNNELYYEECVWYINQLKVPDGYETDIICIEEAESMTLAYNAAMESSDAKYKVYLHQDVFIYHRDFIVDILKIFENNRELGLLGVIGGNNLPQDAEIWNAWNIGCTLGCNSEAAVLVKGSQDENAAYMEVEAIDGMLMVTQYDVYWREDLDLGWDFYDVSQSLEFRRRGYKVGIPFQREPWCMHDCGFSKINHYDEVRKTILEEYKDFFSEPYKPQYNAEVFVMEEQMFKQLKSMMEERNFEQVSELLPAMKESSIKSNKLQYIMNMMEIYLYEKNREVFVKSFFDNLYTWEEMKDKYDEIKFVLRHAENGTNEEQIQNLQMLINNGIISKEAVTVIMCHAILDRKTVIKRVFGGRVDE